MEMREGCGGWLRTAGRVACLLCWTTTWTVGAAQGFHYVKWQPVDVVSRLELSHIRPEEAFRALEAVRKEPVDHAVKAIVSLHFDIEQLYNVLKEMRLDPMDAYSALEVWMHKTTTSTKYYADETKFLDILDDIVNMVSGKASKTWIDITKDMTSLIGAEPEQFFNEVFNNHPTFSSWKTNHPRAFEFLKKMICEDMTGLFPNIRQNICSTRGQPQQQPAAQQPSQPLPQSQPPPQPPQPAAPQSQPPPQPPQPAAPQPQPPSQPPQPQQPAQPQAQPAPQRASVVHHHHRPPPSVQLHNPNDPDLQDPQFADTARYNRIHDETHVFHKTERDPAHLPRKVVHNIRRYFDNQLKVVVESIKTIEHHDSGFKNIQKNIRTLRNDSA